MSKKASARSAPLLRVHPPLTGRQQRVLQGVVDGLTNKELADQIGVTESAVKGTLQQLFRKAHVRTRVHLVRLVFGASVGDVAHARISPEGVLGTKQNGE